MLVRKEKVIITLRHRKRRGGGLTIKLREEHDGAIQLVAAGVEVRESWEISGPGISARSIWIYRRHGFFMSSFLVALYQIYIYILYQMICVNDQILLWSRVLLGPRTIWPRWNDNFHHVGGLSFCDYNPSGCFERLLHGSGTNDCLTIDHKQIVVASRDDEHLSPAMAIVSNRRPENGLRKIRRLSSRR